MRGFIKEKIKMTTQKLQELKCVRSEKLVGFKVMPTGYKGMDNCPPADDSWADLNYGDMLDGVDNHYWIYKKVRTPEKNNKYERLFLTMEFQYGPQFLLYLDGKVIQDFDVFHKEAELEFGREYDLHLYLYTNTKDCGNLVGKTIFTPEFKVIDSRIDSLYYDMKVPFDTLDCLKPDDDNAVITQKHLELACNLLDLRLPYSEEFYNSVKEATEYLKKEYYGKECGRSEVCVGCVGHSHIDVAWRWTLEQTSEKVQRTFSNALRLMDEYDEYVFTASQIPLFKYAKKYTPDIFEKLQKKVKEGQFDPEGAMYVEADCNLSSGESLIRQIMFGKKFYKEEFGVESKTLWLPDVFGYSSALPQILKKSGVDKFVTSKISWNESNTLPYDAFMWEGLDGTEIFTAFITAQEYSPDKKVTGTTYVGNLKPSQIMGARNRFQQKEYSKNGGFMTFGFGDGGGGTTRVMLENYRRLEYGLPGMPKVKIRKVNEYLDVLEKDFMESEKQLREMPRWVGELYLEFHRGTYTSVARNKKNNRKSEFLLREAEQLSTIGNKLFGQEYKQNILNDCWELVLLNQFHDIIPGSSIKEVYEDSDRHYAEIKAKGGEIANTALCAIADGVSADSGYVVYNPNSFEVGGYADFDGRCGYVEAVPSIGWTVAEPDYTNNIKVSDNTIENKFYVIKLDENANITSVYDKEYDREVICDGKKANQFEAFEDLPYQYDNWELSEYYKQKKWNVDDVQSIEAIEDGGRSGFKIVRHFLNSVICQSIWVYEKSRRIDFETEIDWKESHIVLKAAFPINVHADKASYDTQFGYVERPTHVNTSWDAAKFEVCAHKYADISEDDYGAAILNDCKYGYNAEGSTLKLTLLKCGTYPYEEADKEHHSFTYSFMPHGGNHKSGGVIREAYALNCPLTAVEAKGDGSLDGRYSLVECDRENVIIETVKKAEREDATVVRMYDAYNRSAKAKLTFGFDVTEAYLCDLMENKLEPVEISGNSVTVPVSPFEIVTLMIK